MTVQSICMKCLRGYAEPQQTHCHACSGLTRRLAAPVAVSEFRRLSREQRAWLKLAPRKAAA